jgi:PAS domain S-box-containing protein
MEREPKVTGGSVSDATTETTREARLRRDAEARLNTGTAPPTSGWTVSPEALSLLYRLASAADTAGDALKLLHELQAHQVELDLQQDQMEADQRELAGDLARYRMLFDSAPVAYFVCDLDGRIIEGNRAGARLLGVPPAAVGDRPFADFLLPESQRGLIAWLRSARTAGSSLSCEVRPAVASGDSRTWRITATVAPGGDAMVMLLAERVGPEDG